MHAYPDFFTLNNFLWFDATKSLVFLIVLFLLFVSVPNHFLLKLIALNTSCFLYLVYLFLWFFLNKCIGSFQFVSKLLWIFFLSFFYFRFIVVLYLFWKYINSDVFDCWCEVLKKKNWIQLRELHFCLQNQNCVSFN